MKIILSIIIITLITLYATPVCAQRPTPTPQVSPIEPSDVSVMQARAKGVDVGKLLIAFAVVAVLVLMAAAIGSKFK